MTIRERYRLAATAPAKKGYADWRSDMSLVGKGICPYCGKLLKSDKTTYCKRCADTGFANVHKTFGKTNGWNRRPIRVPTIRDGWRGRSIVCSKG